MKFFAEEENAHVFAKTLSKTSELKKDVSVGFEKKLAETKEMDETQSKNVKDKKRISIADEKVRRNDERPKSAGCLARKGLDRGCKKRPKSTESFRNNTESQIETKKRHKQLFEIRETLSPGTMPCKCAELLDWQSKFPGLCCHGTLSCACEYKSNSWASHNDWNLDFSRRKCRSNPNFSKTFFEKEKDLCKMKRSLRLIGLELSDFGIYSDEGAEGTPRWKYKRKPLTFSTKPTGRRFSLESLRHEIRRAWLDDGLDKSHRKLLSQAAYEEWYLKKEKQLQQKLDEEKQKKAETQVNLRKDLEEKKAKADEEFRKWMWRKRMKKKETEKENPVKKKSENDFGRITKTKQDSEAAFLKWKKEKDKELEKKRQEKKKEEGEKMESERKKNEKRMIAEKAFQQWKIKLEESERLEEKREKQKRKQEELERRQKREENSQISFQVWKKLKDEEIRQRLRQIREMTKLAKEEREARLEERMYEAEQAFEDWLEKVESRKQKQFCDNFQKIPWIPV